MNQDQLHEAIQALSPEALDQLLRFLAWPVGADYFQQNGYGRWDARATGLVPYAILARVADGPEEIGA